MNNHWSLDLVGCPQCGAPAEVLDRFELTGSDGPVEHVKVRCVHRHWFLLPADRLPAAAAVTREEQVRWTRHP